MANVRDLRGSAFSLVVLTIVILAICTLILQHRSRNVDYIANKRDLFWSERPLPPEPMNEDSQAANGNEPKKNNLLRLVHIDLKGAAPQISYFEQVFPLFSKLGANGLLIEYEDMFPFQGELEILSSSFAYSEKDIDRILHLAEINALEVVPLVQCFGHMEYVLKHDKYRHLREVEKYPNSLNPHVAESLDLVKMIFQQVLAKHPKTTWLHIGGDEVFFLGEGQDSKAWMKNNNGGVGKIYMKHIKAVLDDLNNNYRGVEWLMWDDMLRKIEVKTIKESGIMEHTAPMIWLYSPSVDSSLISQYIKVYQDCGFKTVWFASAFKGATIPAMVWTPIGQRQKNHQGWAEMLMPAAKAKFPEIVFQGIALTGWQRFDHFSELCELLPVAIPSLAICLQTLLNGEFSAEAKNTVIELLGFQDIDLTLNICKGNGGFPGSEIYHLVKMIDSDLKPTIKNALNDPRVIIAGWLSHYHRKHRFSNPYLMKFFGSNVLTTHEKLETQIQKLRSHMEAVYFPNTVEEWMEEHVNPYMEPLRHFVTNYQEIIKLNAHRKLI